MRSRLLWWSLWVGLAGCGGGSASVDLGPPDLVTPACVFEPFVDCGCGCCGGVEPADVCVRASLGQTLESVRGVVPPYDAEKCATAGCSPGTRYRCCD